MENKKAARIFASNLRHLRERAGLTVERLAKSAQVSATSIRWWESAGSSLPNIDDAARMAKAMNATTDELLEGLSDCKKKIRSECDVTYIHAISRFLSFIDLAPVYNEDGSQVMDDNGKPVMMPLLSEPTWWSPEMEEERVTIEMCKRLEIPPQLWDNMNMAEKMYHIESAISEFENPHTPAKVHPKQNTVKKTRQSSNKRRRRKP